jgi:hypothetical protein
LHAGEITNPQIKHPIYLRASTRSRIKSISYDTDCLRDLSFTKVTNIVFVSLRIEEDHETSVFRIRYKTTIKVQILHPFERPARNSEDFGPTTYTMHLRIAGVIAMQLLCTMALHIASLGSSYAAGPGVRKNYAKVLSEKLGAQLTDLSVSGTTLLSMASQINRIPRDVDIVTVTSGGNDLNYVGGLTLGFSMSSSVSEQALTGRFNDALAKIHAKAPKATIYVAEYLTMLGPDVKPGSTVSFSASQVESHRRVFNTLLKATQAAATGKDYVRDVPVARLSQGHGLGSREPWVNGNRVSGGGAIWHPNQAGMTAIAGMIYDMIKGGKGAKRARQ